MPNLPVDADASPNYTAAQHATHHDTLHATQNTSKAAARVATRQMFR
jgi:hypothetical protein